MRPINEQVLTAADASKDEASAPIRADQLFYMSVQAIMTGTSSGTLKLQFSNDPCEGSIGQKVPVPTNWSDIANASVTITGTAGVFAIPKTELCYRFVRVMFAKNNGASGTVTATIQGMGA